MSISDSSVSYKLMVLLLSQRGYISLVVCELNKKKKKEEERNKKEYPLNLMNRIAKVHFYFSPVEAIRTMYKTTEASSFVH